LTHCPSLSASEGPLYALRWLVAMVPLPSSVTQKSRKTGKLARLNEKRYSSFLEECPLVVSARLGGPKSTRAALPTGLAFAYGSP